LSGEPMTLDQVAKELGYSREHIRRTETKALKKLKNSRHIAEMRDYLS
jgi:DNA-directed RNA polymerase sigma subunit (sigma70/sigma32)